MTKKEITTIPLRINRENLEKISSDAHNTLQINLVDSNGTLSLLSNFFGKSANLNLQGYKNLPILKIRNTILVKILINRKPIFDLLSEVIAKAANELCETIDYPSVEEIARKVAELLSIVLNEDVISINKPTNHQDGYSPSTNQIGINNEITNERGVKIQRIQNIPLDILEKAK